MSEYLEFFLSLFNCFLSRVHSIYEKGKSINYREFGAFSRFSSSVRMDGQMDVWHSSVRTAGWILFSLCVQGFVFPPSGPDASEHSSPKA
jgi:hypothetical protein